MKKSFIIAILAMLFPTLLVAQTVNNFSMQAPSKIDLPENQRLLGHYTSDAIATTGALMSGRGVQPLAVIFTPDELDIFQGGKIVAFRVGLVEPAEVSRVFVIPISATGKYGDKIEWSCNVGDAGWNWVDLETPYEINLGADEQLMVGFYYKQDISNRPISLVKEGDPYETYTYKRVGSTSKWKEMGFIDMGNLSVQCVVEKENYPDYLFTFKNMLSRRYVKAGDELPFMVNINNKGSQQVEAGALSLDVMIDGNYVTSMTNDTAFDNSLFSLSGYVPTDGFESGDHVLEIKPATINGEPLEEGSRSALWDFKLYQRDFPRQKHLVEQLTSTYCTYCPLGNSMLSILTSQRDDIVWVGIHGDLGSGVDPFHSGQGDSLMVYMTGGSISYPSGAFDRSTGWDDDATIVNGLGFYEEYHQMVADMLGEFFDYISDATPTFAEINGDCRFNESTREATVSIYGDLSSDFNLMLGEDTKLTVYLVEDSLLANQLNNGTWVRNYVHNGVFRAALGSIMGNQLKIREDGTYKNKFKYTIPDGWNWQNMRVVAFISRPLSNSARGYTDLIVNNAADFKLELSVGVDEVLNKEDAVPVDYYDLMGRRSDGLHQGINIVKMSDGTARKIFVK